MIKREKAEKILLDIRTLLTAEERQRLQTILSSKRKMMPGVVNNIYLGIQKSDELTDEERFWVLDALKEIGRIQLDFTEMFSEREIGMYTNSSNIEEKIYPINLGVVQQIDIDHWKTVINTNMIAYLFEKQILNYNIETQRNPIIKKVGENQIIYTPNLNRKAINSICDLLLKNQYIPDDLTFNIPLMNTNVDFEITNGELILYSGQMDIIDGYHRCAAIQKAAIADPNLQLVFGLNVTNFSEEKAKRYIWQKAQNTPLRKAFIDSLEKNSAQARIINMLNENNESLVKGLIGYGSGAVINMNTLSQSIKFCFNLDNESNNIKNIILIYKKIVSALNTMIMTNPSLLDKKWTPAQVMVVIRGISNDASISVIEKVMQMKEISDASHYKNVTKLALKKINNIIERLGKINDV